MRGKIKRRIANLRKLYSGGNLTSEIGAYNFLVLTGLASILFILKTHLAHTQTTHGCVPNADMPSGNTIHQDDWCNDWSQHKQHSDSHYNDPGHSETGGYLDAGHDDHDDSCPVTGTDNC